MCAAPWSWHQFVPLCPAGVGPWSHSPVWMQCAEEWCRSVKRHKCTDADTHTRIRKQGQKISLPFPLVIPYLWGEVDIGSSVEQKLSYIQVFIVCSNVEGCESSLQGHIRMSTCHSHYLCILETQTQTKQLQQTQMFIPTVHVLHMLQSYVQPSTHTVPHTLLRTSGLGSFCRSTAAVRVSSLRAAMCSAGRRTFPLVP